MFDLTIGCHPKDRPSKDARRSMRLETGSNGFSELYHLDGPDGFEFNKIHFEASHEILLGPWKDINGFLFAADTDECKRRILTRRQMTLVDELLALLPQNESPIKKPSIRYRSFT